MQSFEVPQNLQCFLCDKFFIKSSHPFILYQCAQCSEKTPYCLNCSNITNKLLDNITFKCKICNNLQRSKFKEEITKQNNNINNNENIYNENVFSPIIKTPTKENVFLNSISNNNGNSNPDLFFSNNINMFRPRDNSLSKSNSCNSIRSTSNNNNSFEYMNNDQNLINDFNNKIVLNNGKIFNNNNSSLMNNSFNNSSYNFNNNHSNSLLTRYNLLKNKKNLFSIKKKTFLSSVSHSSSKHYCVNPEIDSNNNNNNNYNNNNFYNFNNNFGQNSIIGNPNQTPHKFIIPNFDSNSFQISSI